MSNSIDDIDKVLQEIDTEIATLEAEDAWKINVAKTDENKYMILFTGKEENCTHAKHVSKIKGYTFIFCKNTKNPIALYCADEITDFDEATEMITLLANEYSLLHDMLGSPYFKALANVLVKVDEVGVVFEG